MDGPRYVGCREAALIGANELTGDVGMEEADQRGQTHLCRGALLSWGAQGGPGGGGSESQWSLDSKVVLLSWLLPHLW